MLLDATNLEVINKSFEEAKHPRDNQGRFASGLTYGGIVELYKKEGNVARLVYRLIKLDNDRPKSFEQIKNTVSKITGDDKRLEKLRTEAVQNVKTYVADRIKAENPGAVIDKLEVGDSFTKAEYSVGAKRYVTEVANRKTPAFKPYHDAIGKINEAITEALNTAMRHKYIESYEDKTHYRNDKVKGVTTRYRALKSLDIDLEKAVKKDKLPEGGVWRTIKGHKVYIKDGKVLAGHVPGVTDKADFKKLVSSSGKEYAIGFDGLGDEPKKTPKAKKAPAKKKEPTKAKKEPVKKPPEPKAEPAKVAMKKLKMFNGVDTYGSAEQVTVAKDKYDSAMDKKLPKYLVVKEDNGKYTAYQLLPGLQLKRDASSVDELLDGYKSIWSGAKTLKEATDAVADKSSTAPEEKKPAKAKKTTTVKPAKPKKALSPIDKASEIAKASSTGGEWLKNMQANDAEAYTAVIAHQQSTNQTLKQIYETLKAGKPLSDTVYADEYGEMPSVEAPKAVPKPIKPPAKVDLTPLRTLKAQRPELKPPPNPMDYGHGEAEKYRQDKEAWRQERHNFYDTVQKWEQDLNRTESEIIKKDIGRPKAFKSTSEANEYFHGKGVKVANFEGIDPRVMRSIKEAFDTATSRYPELIDQLPYFGSGSGMAEFYKSEHYVESVAKALWKHPNNVKLPYSEMVSRAREIQKGTIRQFEAEGYKPSSSTTMAHASSDGITLNPSYYGKAERVAGGTLNSVLSGWLAEGDGTSRGLIYHELGHRLADIMLQEQFKRPGTSTAVTEFTRTAIKEGSEGIKKAVSEYATTNDNELLAELFNKHMSGTIGNSKIEKAYMLLIETAFGKR